MHDGKGQKPRKTRAATLIKKLKLSARIKAQQAEQQQETCITLPPAKCIFFYFQYHQNDVHCTTLHAIYMKECKNMRIQPPTLETR